MADLSQNTRTTWYHRPDGSSVRQSTRTASTRDWREVVTPQMVAEYRDRGVVYIPQIIDPEWLGLIEQGMRRNTLNPGPHGIVIGEGSPGSWFMDHGNFFANPEYQQALFCSPIADIMCELLDTRDIWLFHEQIFVKQGGNNTITYWHQDLPYWVIEGEKVGSMWVNLDPVPKEYCLEFVPGSHRGTQYAGSTFNPNDPTEPVYPSLPRIPDIEAERDKWEIVSWAIEPGDVVIIHPGVLHGGGATGPGGRRRTISFRFFGDDAVRNGRFEREGEWAEPHYPALATGIGEPVHDPRFVKLRSADATLPDLARRWMVA